MYSYTILGFTYEADLHCRKCAEDRFPELAEDDEAEEVEDSEGNPVHPYFASDASDADSTEYCGDCGDVIYAVDPPSLPEGYTLAEDDYGNYKIYRGDVYLSQWPDGEQAAIQNEESDDGVTLGEDAQR